MGDIFNYEDALSNLKYNDIKVIKNLLRNFYNLFSLWKMGSVVAGVIYMDLNNAINSSGVTRLQKKLIFKYFIHGFTLEYIASEEGRSVATIHENIQRGVKNIQGHILGFRR